MTDPVEVRLQRLLGGDNLAPLRKRLRRRFERAPLDAAVEVIHVDKLTMEEHAALSSLIGRPYRYTNSMQIDVRLIDSALQQAGIASSLHQALERIDGPIVNLAKARLYEQTAWSAVIDGCRHPDLNRLLRNSTGLRLVKRIARQDPSTAVELCRRAEAVLQRLPANGMTRSQLAADVLGNAHALDNGQGTASIVLAVWRRNSSDQENDDALSVSDDSSSSSQAGEIESDRDTWAKAGVLVNELARPALFLNLPTADTASRGGFLGEPAYASLRSLVRSASSWHVANRKVYVCENPNLVAIAADHWGPRCAPLVCTEGMPGAAQRYLLSQLSQAGAQLCYHGDFDWPGIRIGNHVMRTHGAQPWRFTAADYAAAINDLSGLGSPLAGNITDAFWDKDLAITMQRRQIAIAEEALAGSLLQDLVDP
jgi:uncharacterized protein (TIGR02679 family)